MDALRSLGLAFSCFTRLPVPAVEWKQQNLRFIMMWLPLVGLVVGACVWLWLLFASAAGLGVALRAVGVALVPLAVSGGFHLDGFADVVDAQASHAAPERKHEILKDPHIGSFAAWALVAYVLVYFALATELPDVWRVGALLTCLHVLSRSGAGFASSVFWGSGRQGMLTSFRDSADVRVTVAVLAACFAAAGVVAIALSPLGGCLMVVVEVGLLVWLNWFARKNFGGMSGDVAGFFVQVCEIALLACIVVAAKAVGL